MKPVDRVPSISVHTAWALVLAGKLHILDLRTGLERQRFGWPPGSQRVSLPLHVAKPKSRDDGVAYLCQHANRSKLTARNGAPEIAGGFKAWVEAGLPIER